jgi:aspartyl-tRNA(Asn)/glutamyl-tRNA(Gln) amidotransferase subunit A
MPESSESELLALSIGTLAARIAALEVSPVEVVEAALARIEAREPDLNAFISVERDEARRTAVAADTAIRKGRYRGPLHGVPVAIKDLFAVRGRRTTFGSPYFAGGVADEDATVVRRLRRAGAIVIGYTNLDELAFGSTTDNPHFGPTRNPWDMRDHAGGSSGGSAAAVAAGMAFGALGSDTGVSIRQPAACCGIVGLKPTAGLVSKRGALPLSRSLDHIGPMTRGVVDAALMLQVLARAGWGRDSVVPASAFRRTSSWQTATLRSLQLSHPHWASSRGWVRR